MTRPYVTEVVSNIKCGVNAKLGQKTLILGPRGSGKSTHVNAIELATTGEASDIAGRALMAKDSDLWQMAPKGAESIFAHVKWSDGAESKWDLTLGKRSKLSNAVPNVFPLQDVRKALLGSAETARKFMLSQLSPERFNWREVIPESLREKFKADMQRPLVELLEHAKRRARELTSEHDEHERLARSMASGLPPEGQDQTSTKIDDRELRGEIEAHQAELAKVTGQISYLEIQYGSLPEVTIDHEQAELLKAMADVMDWHKANHETSTCIICGVATPGLIERITERRDKIRAKVEGQLKVSQERSQVRSQIVEAQRKLPLINAQIRALELELAAINQPKNTTWAEVKQHQEKALSCKTDAAEWKNLAEYCATALKSCLVRAKDEFEKKVQSFLPDSQRFLLELNQGESEVFRYGLYGSDGHMRYALSKGEEAMVLCAMSMVLSKADGPSIIVPPETGWDPDGLAETLKGWSGTDRQVIVTSTVEPREVPEGWVVIRMTGEKAGSSLPTQVMTWPEEKKGRKSRKKVEAEVLPGQLDLEVKKEEQKSEPVSSGTVDPNSLF